MSYTGVMQRSCRLSRSDDGGGRKREERQIHRETRRERERERGRT